MNEKLQEAEHILLEFLSQNAAGVTMKDILEHFRSRNVAESELRAALWTLRVEGAIDFDKDNVKVMQAVA